MTPLHASRPPAVGSASVITSDYRAEAHGMGTHRSAAVAAKQDAAENPREGRTPPALARRDRSPVGNQILDPVIYSRATKPPATFTRLLSESATEPARTELAGTLTRKAISQS